LQIKHLELSEELDAVVQMVATLCEIRKSQLTDECAKLLTSWSFFRRRS